MLYHCRTNFIEMWLSKQGVNRPQWKEADLTSLPATLREKYRIGWGKCQSDFKIKAQQAVKKWNPPFPRLLSETGSINLMSSAREIYLNSRGMLNTVCSKITTIWAIFSLQCSTEESYDSSPAVIQTAKSLKTQWEWEEQSSRKHIQKGPWNC